MPRSCFSGFSSFCAILKFSLSKAHACHRKVRNSPRAQDCRRLQAIAVEGKQLEAAFVCTAPREFDAKLFVLVALTVERLYGSVEADTVELRTVCIAGRQSVQRSHERIAKSPLNLVLVCYSPAASTESY